MTETQWQRTLTNAAETLGWQWLHIGRVGKYQANGAKGTIGKGWPDLTLIKAGRILFIECKLDGDVLKPDQKRVQEILVTGGHEYYVLRPSDYNLALDILAGAS